MKPPPAGAGAEAPGFSNLAETGNIRGRFGVREAPPARLRYRAAWRSRSSIPARRALLVDGGPSAARFVPERLGEGNGPVYGRYRRLGDNAMDENHFPILWTRNGHRTKGLEAYLGNECSLGS